MTYEYQCRSCGHQWEEEQRITDSPSTQCPECQKQMAMRLISRSTFILSGTKWESKDGY